MESTWLRPALPHALPLAFAFVSCFVSGTLAIGEGIVFMFLYNISRSYGLLGGGAPRFQGVLFSQLISAFSQLPVVFAGRHEMAIVLGYGVVMVIVSLCFITLGVGMLLSGQEDVFLLYSGGVFMLFSFWQILKCSVEFGQERLNCAAPVTRQIALDPTGTSVISTLDYSSETLARDFSLLSRLLQSQPRCLSVLHDTSPQCNSDLCVKILESVVFPDDNSLDTELRLCRCISSMLAAHVAACSDLTTLLREDCTATKLTAVYCRRHNPQQALSRILDPIFDEIIRSLPPAAASAPPDHLSRATQTIVSAICSRAHDLPLGVKLSASSLIYTLNTHHNLHDNPLLVASAVGAIVFLRCVVPYTVQQVSRHAFARQQFNDIASILQKISNGTQFSPAHKLSSFNTEIRSLSSQLHSSLLSAFSNPPQSASDDEDCVSHSAPAIALDTLASRASDIRLFCCVLSESAAAHKPDAFSPGTPLHAALTRCAGLSAHHTHPPPAVPHWHFVSGVLKNHPNLASTYEHFFPNISESGTSVETATVVLLLGTAASAIVSTAVGAGGPPRMIAYHFLDLTKGSMRGLSWVFYCGTLLSLSEIARDPLTNTLVMSETWLYVGMALCALVGSQCGTHLRQYVNRRVVMFGMYVLLWVNCCLLFWPWDTPHAQLSLEPRLFLLGSAALIILAPICFFYPATIRLLLGLLKSLLFCSTVTGAADINRMPEHEKTRLLYGTE